MAGLAVHSGDVVRMRIFLDVGVAVVALQAAVNTGAELVAINGDAVPSGVLHGFVTMAGEAICLRSQVTGRQEDQKRQKTESDCAATSSKSEEVA